MSDGLTRDALIEQVRDGLARWPIGSGFYDMSEEVVDAVLRAVADDLEAWADDEDCGCQTTADWTLVASIVSLTANGVRDAAERVRGLLGKGETNGDA